jgi:iron-sulfur cluster repair protein YtfE (RIC family)
MIQIGGPAEHTFADPLGLLSDCHRRIEMFLGRMILAAERFQGGSLPDNARRALEGSLQYFRGAAHLHMADEEETLFPLLRTLGDPRLTPLIDRLTELESEHRAFDAGHLEADRFVSRWLEADALPQGELARLTAVLADLQGRYQTHIAFEDAHLLPLVAAVLTIDQQQAIGQAMADRRGVPFSQS